MTSPRSNRTKLGTNTMAMAMAASLMSAPSNAATVRARMSGGNEKRASIVRMITESTAPRKNPAIRPSGMAMTAARPTISNDARSEMRAPQIRRLRMSRPRSSVPSQCESDGPALTALMSCGVGRVGRDQRGEDRGDDHDEEEDQAGDGPSLMEEADPEPRPPFGQLVGAVPRLGDGGEADERVAGVGRAPGAHGRALTTGGSSGSGRRR